MPLPKALARLLGLLLVALVLQACPRMDEPLPTPGRGCEASTCEGCCRVDGRCMTGTALTICGKGGESCQNCTGAGACVNGACVATTPDAGGTPDAGNPPDAGSGEGGGDAGVPATGNGCADPLLLQVLDGGAYAVGDTSGHENLGAGPCGGAGGKDVAYRLQVPSSSGQVLVTVTPLTRGGLQPVVYMSELCDTPKYCVAAGTVGAPATLLTRAPASGKPYYLWVDGAPGTSGPYSIRVSTQSGLGESCGAPIDLPFDQDEANVSVQDTSWRHDTQGSCETWTNSGDHVYRLTLDRVRNLEVRVTADSFLGDTYLRGVCGGGELVCTGSGGSGSVIRRQELAAGTYYLWRDTPGSTYDLFAHLSDPLPGDSCTYARPLVFSNGQEGGTATDTATTAGLFDNHKPGCVQPSGASDLVYTFTTSRELDFRASAGNHTLSLRSATCTGAELACGTDGLVRGALPPGTYYLWLDDRLSPGTGRPFTLSASLTPPVQGDSCANPRPLLFSGGSLGGDAREQGNLNNNFSHSSASCGGTGDDHVYTFTTSRVMNLRAYTGQGKIVSLRSGDCPSQTELTCSRPYGHNPLEILDLTAGTYQLWVDSDIGGGGNYTLWATLTEPSCQSPIPLVFTGGGADGQATATASGNTDNAFSTTQGSCGGTATRELAYAFELTEPRRIDATVTSTSTLRPVLYLRASCGADELACAAAPSANASATLSTGVLQPGRYYLWVDGFSGTVGPYTLSVTSRP